MNILDKRKALPWVLSVDQALQILSFIDLKLSGCIFINLWSIEDLLMTLLLYLLVVRRICSDFSSYLVYSRLFFVQLIDRGYNRTAKSALEHQPSDLVEATDMGIEDNQDDNITTSDLQTKILRIESNQRDQPIPICISI
ncbi:unnamed protein product, partial [Brachionus calyciflorus]